MKRVKLSVILVLTIIPLLVYAVNLRRIIRAIEKQDFDKAIEWLQEEIRDEPVNPGAYLLYAQLLAEDSLSYYDLDQARKYIFIAVDQYDTASEEILEELEKVSIFSLTIDNTYDEIKQQVFRRTLEQNTLEQYEEFMRLYPGTDQSYIAIEKRDSIAFERTQEIDTWQAYQEYFQTYPQSGFSPVAEVRYQRLVYQDKTRTNEPADLERFLLEHPNSPYREVAATRLYKEKLITGDPEAYRRFIETYADTEAALQAYSVLYHLDSGAATEVGYPGRYDFLDSIRRVESFNDEILFAFQDDNKVGLMTFMGEIFLRPQYKEILNEDAFCQALDEDVLSFRTDTGAVLTNRLGEVFFVGDFTSVGVGEHGLIAIRQGQQMSIVHKAGNVLFEDVEDYHVVNSRWIAIRRDGYYALASFAGKTVTPFLFSDVEGVGEFILFYNTEDRVSVYNNEGLARALEMDDLTPLYEYEEVELIGDKLLIAYTGSQQCLFDSALAPVVPCGDQKIYIDDDIIYTTSSSGFQLFDRELAEILGGDVFADLMITDHWLCLKDDFWRVYNRGDRKVLKNQFDSVSLPATQVLFAQIKSQQELIFADGKSIAVKDRLFKQLPGDEYMSGYLWLGDGREATVYDPRGEKVLETKYSDLRVIDENLFGIKVSGKSGVMTAEGRLLLPPSYDLIQKKDNQLYTLKYGKIGNVDLETGTIFDNEYEAAFEKKYGYFSTALEGKAGLLNENKERVLDFDFESIEVISDSLAWVKTDTTWVMLTLPDKRIRMDGITRFAPMEVDGYYKVYSARGFGIMTAEGEFLFNPVYSDVVVLQSENQLLFRAENYFQEAEYYIVVWYDTDGRKIYSNAYRTRDYEMLYCD